MGAEDDRGSLGGEAADGVLHPADGEGIQAGERFVEEDHPGRMQEAAGDLDLLLHAAGEVAGELVGLRREFEFFQQPGVARRGVRHLVEARGEVEVLTDREVFEEPGFVREEGEFALGPDGIGGEVVSGNAEGAAGGRADAGKGTEGGGLAGAVGSAKAQEFAGLHAEGQRGHGSEVTVEFGQAFDLDHVMGSMRT